MSKVATVEQIFNIRKHPNADALEIGNVLGWQVVCKSGVYRDGDKVIYVNIDSVLEERPEYEFLRSKNFRIKPVRLRGEISQGLCFPCFYDYDIGTDVSQLVGAKHYEKPVSPQLSGQVAGVFPHFLVKTDEDNLRNYSEVLEEVKFEILYTTIKIDGTSATYFVKDGEFGMCSRNLQLKVEDENSIYAKMAVKYNIREKMLNYAKEYGDFCIQGEIYGPGVQNNSMGAKENCFSMFSGYKISGKVYWGYSEIKRFCDENEIPRVTFLSAYTKCPSLQEFITFANNTYYENGKPAEGIVIRPWNPIFSHVLKKNWSVKIINENYDD
jgi:RNA ligase (TIGR02306 family)